MTPYRRARSGSGPRLPARGAGRASPVSRVSTLVGRWRPRASRSRAALLLVPRGGRADGPGPTIAGRAGRPCVEQAWSDCAVRAPGGLTPAEWYEETRFEASEYPVEVDADGAPVGEPGVEVAVGTARALYGALENRDVSRILRRAQLVLAAGPARLALARRRLPRAQGPRALRGRRVRDRERARRGAGGGGRRRRRAARATAAPPRLARWRRRPTGRPTERAWWTPGRRRFWSSPRLGVCLCPT